jgi:hypothetical protein
MKFKGWLVFIEIGEEADWKMFKLAYNRERRQER